MSEKEDIRFYSEDNQLNWLPEVILAEAQKGVQGVPLKEEDLPEALGITKNVISLIKKFEQIARTPHKNVAKDIDVVWVLAAPGHYSRKFSLSVEKARSDAEKLYRWPEVWPSKMYRHRLLTGAALVKQVTAQRLNKEITAVSAADIKEHGPLFVYNPDPADKEHIEEIISQASVILPAEKRYIFYEVASGKEGLRPIKNMIDQVESFHLPNGSPTGKIATVLHTPDLVRFLYVLEKHKEVLPKGAKYILFP